MLSIKLTLLLSLLLKQSTIRWCEATNAYKYSNYIAEFYNALTGLCLCLSVILFYFNNKKRYKLYKLKKSLILLFTVGIGTVLFHSTLLYVFQMMDEIPMLLLISEYVDILSELSNNGNKFDSLTIYYICGFIFVVGFFNDFLQVLIFQSVFSYFVIMAIYDMYTISNAIEHYSYRLSVKKDNFEEAFLYNYIKKRSLLNLKNKICTIKKLKKKLQSYQHIGIYILLSSITVWYIDKNYCTYVNYIGVNGHAVWHILTSIGLYYFNHIILIYYKLQYLFFQSL